LTAALLVGCTAGCIALEQGDRVPEALVDQAVLPEYTGIRFYANDPKSLRDLAEDRVAELRDAPSRRALAGKAVKINYLSLSGGAGDGAYGAGFLNGWSAAGTRPVFDVVTGISTGALIAPFAYLGSSYDGKLRQAYTGIRSEDVEVPDEAVPAVLGLAASLSSSDRLEALIAKHVTPKIVREIAEQYRSGRMLLIGTTNLDAQRPVIWDIGAIAATGRPDALPLIRQIILASAAVPGLFPPVRIKVGVDGKNYDEWHVDGGVTRQVFLFPPGYDPKIVDKAIRWRPQRRAFVIRNSKIDPQYEAVSGSMLEIANRSISTLIKSQGIGDLYRIYAVCREYSIDYNVAFIPNEFNERSKELFDKEYMARLYDFAYNEAKRGYAWHKEPPGLDQAPE
jgi:hypothetical protein